MAKKQAKNLENHVLDAEKELQTKVPDDFPDDAGALTDLYDQLHTPDVFQLREDVQEQAEKKYSDELKTKLRLTARGKIAGGKDEAETIATSYIDHIIRMIRHKQDGIDYDARLTDTIRDKILADAGVAGGYEALLTEMLDKSGPSLSWKNLKNRQNSQLRAILEYAMGQHDPIGRAVQVIHKKVSQPEYKGHFLKFAARKTGIDDLATSDDPGFAIQKLQETYGLAAQQGRIKDVKGYKSSDEEKVAGHIGPHKKEKEHYDKAA
ncbi:MAG: hypothetical protein V1735_00900 [Nanoarchaeota archaeon]